MNEQQEQMRKALGIIGYIELQKAINKANAEKKKVYLVTKNKRILENKELIEQNNPDIMVFTEKEWLIFAYHKLSPQEQKKVDEKIIAKIEKQGK